MRLKIRAGKMKTKRTLLMVQNQKVRRKSLLLKKIRTRMMIL